jgi:hypothetical protein
LEVIAFLRVLRRTWLLVALGAIAVAGLAVKTGGATTSSGLAATHVVLDTPESQLVDQAPIGAETLPWRASLMAHLIATEPARDRIARELGLPLDQVAVTDNSVSNPDVPASLPKAAAEAAQTYAPYVLVVTPPPDSLPVIAIEAVAPDRQKAVDLAMAAVAEFRSGGSPRTTTGLQGVVVDQPGTVRSKTVTSNAGTMKAAGTSLVLFICWCMALGLFPAAKRLVLRPPAARYGDA